ncbi:TRAP transporter solute receptor, DctP family protein [Fulvimarina pelagi HTCC2506]|uniref:TRAP transporter solute receptor, DctP family protein n=2 Tax=Fulvimarina pelagi TaxID=217511 RepID=Q0G0B7_9HYPH|nr:DctP family TRAP transporter solute-binding subunit [Fulvimarina pelagi]EAU40676.1 TRAP transporter solute receptor, DctP family protein [Fulvimarina pelagi HTCC2506]BAT31219.1 C4-dicarboxylate-binding periplasmic protein [Fulvimarina pelagi]
MKNLMLGTISGLALVMAAGAAQAQSDACGDGETVIKFSHVVADSGHPKGDAAQLLAKNINEQMDGKACMQVFPNSTLYDDDKVMEALLLGDVQLAAPSLSKFEAYTLQLRLYDLPFLFPTLEAANSYLASEDATALLAALEDEGYKGLGYIASGLKQFSANKPLMLPEDAAGLKFRVQTSDVAVAMIEAMNASAQKLAFKEVYGALQTGVVDGQENTWCNIYTQKFFEVQDGITETNHQLLAYGVITSQEWLDGLEEDVREQFLQILGDTLEQANQQVADQEGDCRNSITEAGAEIRELDDSQRQAWVDTMKPVWDQFEGDIGAEVIETAESYGSTQKADAGSEGSSEQAAN